MKKSIAEIMKGELSEEQKNWVYYIAICLIAAFMLVVNANGLCVVKYREINTFLYWIYNYKHAVYEIIIAVLLLASLASVTGSVKIGYGITAVITVLLGIINKYKYYFRGEYVKLSDVRLLREVAGLKIDFSKGLLVSDLIIIILNVMIFAGLLYFERKTLKKLLKKSKKEYYIKGVTVLVTLGLIIACSYAEFLEDEFDLFHGLINGKDTGSINYLVENMWHTRAEKVTDEVYEKIYDKYYLDDNGEYKGGNNRPNVIAIMSESFWNMNHINELVSLSDNPFDKYEELTKQGISGEIAVNVYGGGTVHTEFEFLTGMDSYGFNSAGDLYRDMYKKPQESIVSYFNKLDYTTLAFHPNTADYWGRDIGYASMGFDEFYDITKFDNRQMFRGYISDISLTDEIIQRFEENKEKSDNPLFVFAVSVQNHGVDLEAKENLDKNDMYSPEIDIEYKYDKPGQKEQEEIDAYINGCNITVAGLEKLMNYFNNKEEETIVVFFGDHAPGCLEYIEKSAATEESEYSFRTPYFIWSNKTLKEIKKKDISACNLSSIMLMAADMPASKIVYANRYLMKRYPVRTLYEIEDANGNSIIKELLNKDNKTYEEYKAVMEDNKKFLQVIMYHIKNGSMETDIWEPIK